MSLRVLKTPLIFACFVLVIFMMRQNDMTPSKGLRHSLRRLTQRFLDSSSRPSVTLCEGIITDESYSSSEVEKANKVGNSLSGIRGGNPLKDWVEDGSSDSFASDYGMGLVPLIAPWPVLALITLLTCFGFVCNWCCMFGCCKNCCKGCKCCKGPREQRKMKVYMAISGVFLLGLLGSAAAGLSFGPGVAKGMNVTYCTALITMENLVYGETAEKWLGFDGVISSLKNVKSKFLTTVNSLASITGDPNGAMTTKYNDAVSKNSDLYTNNQNAKSPRADPAQTTPYTTDYVANLGPVATSDTYTNAIKTELDKWQTTVKTAVGQIDGSITSLQTQKTTIDTALTEGIETAEGITDSLKDVVDSLGDNGASVKSAVKGVGAGLTALFAINLVFAIVGLASIFMIRFMKIKFFSKILHLSWCVIVLMTLLGFIIVTLTMPLSVILVESCEVFRLTLNDEDFFEDATDLLFSGSTKSILQTCFYGTGLALDELGLTNSLSYFDTIYAQLEIVNSVIPLEGGYTAASPPPSLAIPPQQTIVTKTLSGELVDASVTLTDLRALNRGSNKDPYSCVNIRDTWMLNSAGCTSANGYKFLSTDVDTEHAGQKTCIGFVDAWMPNPSPPNDINNRYTSGNFPVGCTSPSLTRVKALVDGFVANRNDIATDYGLIDTDLTAVATAQKDYSKEVLIFLDQLKDVKLKIADLKDSLVGKTNGVIPNTNCKFIGKNMRKLQIGMCATFASSLYQSSVTMIVMSVMAFLATVFTFCLAKRFSLGAKKDSANVSPTHQEMAKSDPFQDPFQTPN